MIILIVIKSAGDFSWLFDLKVIGGKWKNNPIKIS